MVAALLYFISSGPPCAFFGNGFDATNYIATVWPIFIFNELYAHIQA